MATEVRLPLLPLLPPLLLALPGSVADLLPQTAPRLVATAARCPAASVSDLLKDLCCDCLRCPAASVSCSATCAARGARDAGAAPVVLVLVALLLLALIAFPPQMSSITARPLL